VVGRITGKDTKTEGESMDRAPADPGYLTVGEVAARAHVSVRTLHHYDEVGLLTPARRTDAGYRLFEGFEEFDHARYAGEAKERWGQTDAYKESMRRRARARKARKRWRWPRRTAGISGSGSTTARP
jgi:hypothetical protein